MGRDCTQRERALDVFYYSVVFVFGLIFGSFANVVIWRLPRGESLSVPASHCPLCETPITWYDNIPVLSWLLLLGRCRSCGAPISVRYPAVELLSGLLWLASAVRFGLSARAAVAAFFFYMLLLLAFIDADTMRLPNSLVGALGIVGLVCVSVAQISHLAAAPLYVGASGLLAEPGVYAIVGSVASAGFVLVVAAAYSRVRGRQGFGMGDVKLLGVMGLFLGVYTLVVLLLGSVGGAVFGLVQSRRSPEGIAHKFPFGPFLAAAAVIVALWGDRIVSGYLTLIGIS